MDLKRLSCGITRDRQVTVLATEGGALVGMAMLLGFRLTLEGAVGGLVRIEVLS